MLTGFSKREKQDMNRRMDEFHLLAEKHIEASIGIRGTLEELVNKIYKDENSITTKLTTLSGKLEVLENDLKSIQNASKWAGGIIGSLMLVALFNAALQPRYPETVPTSNQQREQNSERLVFLTNDEMTTFS